MISKPLKQELAKLNQELADLLEEDANADKLRSLPLFVSCIIHPLAHYFCNLFNAAQINPLFLHFLIFFLAFRPAGVL
jgi:hypothetical protein